MKSMQREADGLQARPPLNADDVIRNSTARESPGYIPCQVVNATS
jgi:hypothetical protein